MCIKQKSIGLVDLVFALIVLFGGTANAAETLSSAPLEKITIAYSSISGHMAPLWITQDRGWSMVGCTTCFYRKWKYCGQKPDFQRHGICSDGGTGWSKVTTGHRYRDDPGFLNTVVYQRW